MKPFGRFTKIFGLTKRAYRHGDFQMTSSLSYRRVFYILFYPNRLSKSNFFEGLLSPFCQQGPRRGVQVRY
jgi:hypothetical protein